MEHPIVNIVRYLVRPFIAISITTTLIVLAIMGKIDADAFLNLALVVVTFYFAERATAKGITMANGHLLPPPPKPAIPAPEEEEPTDGGGE